MVFIRFKNKGDEARGSLTLSRAGVTYCFPGGVYAFKEAQIEKVKTALEKESIAYRITESIEKGQDKDHIKGHSILDWPISNSSNPDLHDNISN